MPARRVQSSRHDRKIDTRATNLLGLRRGLELLEDRSTPAIFTATVDPGPLGGNNTAAINEILGFFATAVANGESDTINLLPGASYKFTTTNNVLDGNNALPVIGPDGTGKNGITINGQGATFSRFSSEDFRFLRVDGNNNNVSLTINDLTLTGGKSTNGGAILVTNGASLTVNNSTFSSNESTGNGGAIALSGATGGGVFTGVTFSSNTAAGSGGALSNTFDGFFQFNKTKFLNNVSTGGTGGVSTFVGAFEFNDSVFDSNIGKFVGSAGAYSGSEAVFNRVTVTNNTATSGGTGGISSGLANIRVVDSYIAGNKGLNTTGSGGGVQGAKVELYNSTVHNNQSGSGGGVSGTSVVIRHSTITNNTSNFGIAAGGGIQAQSLDIRNSIVALNTNVAGGASGIADIAVTGMTNSTSKGFNFIGVLDASAKFNTAGGDQVGQTAAGKQINPSLSAPGANGGTTFSRIPLSGSPVINAGSSSLDAFNTDQRGYPRRVGGSVDIGAVEVQTGSSVGIVSGSGQTAQTNQAFANLLTVLVTDSNGAPLKSALVRFEAPTVPNPTASAIFFGQGSVTGVTTDNQGMATVSVSANSVAGSYTVLASTIDSPAPVAFNLRNTAFGVAIPPTGVLQIVSGNAQSTTANSTFSSNLKVQVLDTKGLAIANVPISFTSPDTGASITFSNGGTNITASTDVGGFVSLPVTANTLVGSYLVQATGPNVGTVSFSLTNNPAAAAKVMVVSGDGQATLTNTAFNNPLKALVTDIFGNPVLSGVSVTFTGPFSGPGVDFTGKTSTVVLTNSSGIASASPTANATGGAYFVDASVPGGSVIGSFALSNIFVPPPPPPPPPPANGIPTITDVPDQSIQAGGSATFGFGVFDVETLPSNLNVTATSSNPSITPTLTIGGSGTNRTILVGTAGQSGSATITLTVTDELGAQATDNFVVTLVPPPPPPPPPPPNAVPVISDIVNQTVQAGNSLSLPFVVVDAETPASVLTVTAKALNPGLIPTLTVSGADSNRSLNVVSASGQSGTTTVTVTVTDADGNSSVDTFDINVFTVPPPPPPPPPAVPLVGTQQFAVGTGAGGSQAVRFFNADRTERFIAAAFPDLTGGVRTATGDFTGDGIPDVVIGTGPGSITQIQVLDGNTGSELFRMQPFESAFTGGVYVAVGDLSGDGIMDLVITPDEGGGPRARVFNGKGFSQIADFFVIDDANFRGGARAAMGDVNGDGRADLVASAGFGGGPRIAGFDGKTIGVNPQRLFADFFLFEDTLRNGAFIAIGDIDGDGFADIVGGGGPGGGPRVLGLSGKSLLTNAYITRANFFAGDLADRGGVRVTIKNLDGDNRADIVVGSGDGSGNRITGFLGANILPDGTPLAAFNLDTFPGFAGGVFVG